MAAPGLSVRGLAFDPNQPRDEDGKWTSVSATPELLSIAFKDSQKRTRPRMDMESDVQMVVVGGKRSLDNSLDRYDEARAEGRQSLTGYSESEVAAQWAATREHLRKTYGDHLILFRADAPKSEHRDDNRTVYMGGRRLAKQFAQNGRRVRPYRVKTDDVLAVFVPSDPKHHEHPYYEFIVKRPKGGLLRHMAGDDARTLRLAAFDPNCDFALPSPAIRAGAKETPCSGPGYAIIGPQAAENSPAADSIELIGAADPLPSRYRMSKFAGQHAAELVAAPRRVRQIIRNEVRKALRNGEGPDGIANRLISEVDMPPERLDTIARTEFAFARTAARIEEAASDFGDVDLEKTWRADPDCCPMCAAMDGQTVPVDEPFQDAKGGLHAGSPAHPNCRCDIEIREVAEMQRRAAIGFVGAGFDPNQPRDEMGRWVDGSGAVIIDKRVSADEGKAFLEAVDALPEKVKRGIRNKIVQLVPSVEEFGHAHSAGEIFGATGDTGILVKAHPGAKTVLYHEIGHQETKFLAKRPAFQAAFEKDTAKAHRGQLAYYASKPEEAYAQSFAYHMGGDDENRKAFERGFKNSHATLGAHLAKMAAMRKANS